METTLIKVTVANIRPEYQNLHYWRLDKNNVYIGRKGVVFIDGVRYPLENSPWCNPYKISTTLDRDQCIEKYRKYIIEKIEKENLQQELLKLKGKTLGCWCSPEPCHGDVLIDLINQLTE